MKFGHSYKLHAFRELRSEILDILFDA